MRLSCCVLKIFRDYVNQTLRAAMKDGEAFVHNSRIIQG